MESLLKISGGLQVGLALLHAFFPRHFKWSEELRSITLLTRQIHYVHTFFVALTILLVGLLCLTSPADLLHTSLGRKVSLGIGMFWACRLAIQFFGYSPSLWKGKSFETAIHVVFSTLWVFLTVTFGLAAFSPTTGK
jgi:hypothetical protein